ncbi:MAG: hypothetical protein JJD98_01255 [Polaromonas sp.]|nr:hypothetical protein [Polaromonas sp.]
MTDTNEALFVVRLPAGEKTVPFEDIPALIAMAKSPGYDREKASEHEAVIFGLAEMNEEGPLEAAVRAGQVEALNNFTLHRIRPPFTGRLKDAVLTVRALREYVESINGCLQVVETTEPQAVPVGDVGALGGVETVQDVPETPWLVADPKDPIAEQLWYIPARYFARQLVRNDSTLLIKKLVLADKVSRSLASAGIFKRGGIKSHSADTVLKAFSNVTLG